GPDGRQLGVLPTREALEIAKRVGLDLVEVSPNAQPPVCRIVDFGKFMYDQSKKTKDTQKPTAQKVKEIKFRLNIDSHDYITKMRHAEEFLGDGNKLKMTLMFRGRELEHQLRGITLVNQAIQDLSGMGTADNQPKLVGRSIVITMTPIAAQRRKPKFTAPEEEPTEAK
ncbi:MAG TPA: translation initiation factor IF-3, partial [Opitutales bacterium]|nr:translation initiation factor IF-3 [Opitutales bacterium]